MTIGALRDHTFELLCFECGEQIQPSLNNVIGKSQPSGQALGKDSFELGFAFNQ